MKKGDVVTVGDFSYSMIIEDGELRNSFHAFHPVAGKQFVVVDVGCVFPRTSQHPGTNYNNTVLQAVGSTEVVFIEERFLRTTRKLIREVTMAEVCRQFGEDVKIKKDHLIL